MRDALEQQKASILKQKQSIQQQATVAGTMLLPWDRVQANCDPIDEKVVTPLIETAARAQHLEPRLVRAVAEQESAMRPCAISVKGAQGLMQLIPETAQQFGVHDAFDPKENIDAGAKYLKQLMDKYSGDLPKALSAYNAGPATVDQSGGVPNIAETRDYVASIMKKLDPTHAAQVNSPKAEPGDN